jgi:predicted nucleic acid-binding protein
VNEFTIADTDILIDAAKSDNAAVNALDQIELHSKLSVSIITQMELLVGCRNEKELQDMGRFLKRFQIINLNEVICETALELLRRYRMSHGLLIPDALIAATAITMNQPFITKNQKDFRFITGLKLLPYPGLIFPHN